MSLFAAIVVVYLNGKAVDSDILGEAPTMAACKSGAEAALAKGQAALSKDFEIVIKCADEGKMPKINTPEEAHAYFDSLPIAAVGFGHAK